MDMNASTAASIVEEQVFNVCCLSMNSDSILLWDANEVCDVDSSFNLSVRTLDAAVQQVYLCLPAII